MSLMIVSVPVDREASRAARSDADTSVSFALEPLQGPFVLLQERLEPLVATSVMILYHRSVSISNHRNTPTKIETHLQPLALLFGEHGIFHHLCLYRHASEALETEPDLAVELVLGLERSLSDTTMLAAACYDTP